MMPFVAIPLIMPHFIANTRIAAMKYLGLIPVLLMLVLTACGQPGPLYLPKDRPKVYDEPVTETKETQDKKDKAAKPESPPTPKQPVPTKEK